MDEFRLSDYLKDPVDPTSMSNNLKIRLAKEWAQKSMRTIIYPVDNLRELEHLWMEYQLMPIDDRFESDDKSNEIFGMPNQYHYEKLKSEFLKDDIEPVTVEDILDESSEFDMDITYSPIDVEKAIQWSKESGYPIIIPTTNLKDLDNAWNNFLTFPGFVRSESDEQSIEFFGMENEDHYNYLRSELLRDDIPMPTIVQESFIGDPINLHSTFAMNENVSVCERAKDLLTIIARKNENYEESLIQNVVDKATTEYRASNQNIRYDPIPGEDLPFFTPEEMIDAGVNQSNPEDNFYGCSPIADVIAEDGEGFDNYCMACAGLPFRKEYTKWKDSVAELKLKMKTAENKDPYKQSLLNLGWPPEAEFTPENRVLATKRLKSKLAERNGSTQFVDLTGMDANDTDSIEESAKDILKPVYIVLEEGKSAMSYAIKKYTHSIYSHAAISFDPDMRSMYSYGIEGSEKGVIGGFIKEDIRNKLPDSHMSIYAIFLKEKDWKRLKDRVDDYVKNIKKTSYSYINIVLSQVFKIPFDMDRKMFCSQFVDRMLKLTDIDISKKDSSLVNPGDFEKFAKENKKIYILFNDLVSKFKPSRIKNISNRLCKKAEPIKEAIQWTDPVGIVFEMINNINSLDAMQELSTKIDLNSVDKRVRRVYEDMIIPCLEAECYLEAQDLPMQFDKDGNLFIRNMKKRNRDYEAEYAKSHKLLRQYEKVNNIEGMKYELCKLWMMNSLIEAKIYDKNSTDKDLTKETNARAKILNDINYYLGIVLKAEPDFNFQEYFNASPFNDAMIKINRETIIWSSKMLKYLFNSL